MYSPASRTDISIKTQRPQHPGRAYGMSFPYTIRIRVLETAPREDGEEGANIVCWEKGATMRGSRYLNPAYTAPRGSCYDSLIQFLSVSTRFFHGLTCFDSVLPLCP